MLLCGALFAPGADRIILTSVENEEHAGSLPEKISVDDHERGNRTCVEKRNPWRFFGALVYLAHDFLRLAPVKMQLGRFRY